MKYLIVNLRSSYNLIVDWSSPPRSQNHNTVVSFSFVNPWFSEWQRAHLRPYKRWDSCKILDITHQASPEIRNIRLTGRNFETLASLKAVGGSPTMRRKIIAETNQNHGSWRLYHPSASATQTFRQKEKSLHRLGRACGYLRTPEAPVFGEGDQYIMIFGLLYLLPLLPNLGHRLHLQGC